jgi:hypothetical protein
MKTGDKVWAYYKRHSYKATLSEQSGNRWRVLCSAGLVWVNEDDIDDNEYSAENTLIDHLEHEIAQAEIRKNRCADSCLLEDTFGLVKRMPWEGK